MVKKKEIEKTEEEKKDELKENKKEDAKEVKTEKKKVNVLKTDDDSKNGQQKCPKCGSTDIDVNKKTGKLRCNFCRYEYDAEKISGLEEKIDKISGENVASGAQDIEKDAEDVITLKCESCGAEVVIDTKESNQARCHWCRNTLSLNKQIPNGAVPDVILPFKVSKEDARKKIDEFVKKRRAFANPRFKREFTSNNVMQVYFPYMLVDVNAHANFDGEGEKLIRSYTVGNDDNERTYYDADCYHVEREFDIAINGLSIESSSQRLDNTNKKQTNNIINSIMPFDTENCVKYDANYLKHCTSEKRDINIKDLDEVVEAQAKDVAKFAANPTLKKYDRGVAWKKEDLEVKGKQWVAAYLPVWLYSYQEVKGSKKTLHYVAVNARTKETMGSVPINMPMLIISSTILEIIGLFLMLITYSGKEEDDPNIIFLSLGVIFFLVIYYRYRNSGARHHYETETKKEMTNLRSVDEFKEKRKRLETSQISGCNNHSLSGENIKNKNFGTKRSKITVGKKPQK